MSRVEDNRLPYWPEDNTLEGDPYDTDVEPPEDDCTWHDIIFPEEDERCTIEEVQSRCRRCGRKLS